jgi:hypothetical protein
MAPAAALVTTVPTRAVESGRDACSQAGPPVQIAVIAKPKITLPNANGTKAGAACRPQETASSVAPTPLTHRAPHRSHSRPTSTAPQIMMTVGTATRTAKLKDDKPNERCSCGSSGKTAN